MKNILFVIWGVCWGSFTSRVPRNLRSYLNPFRWPEGVLHLWRVLATQGFFYPFSDLFSVAPNCHLHFMLCFVWFWLVLQKVQSFRFFVVGIGWTWSKERWALSVENVLRMICAYFGTFGNRIPIFVVYGKSIQCWPPFHQPSGVLFLRTGEWLSVLSWVYVFSLFLMIVRMSSWHISEQ